jgi:SAM-dependent methyltransferase
MAASYDEDFTDSLIGRLQREAVWRQLGGLLRTGDRILDLGCGTGADALHCARRGMEVEAVDVSRRMIDEARRKISAEGLAAPITARVAAIEDLARWDGQSSLSTQASHSPPEADAQNDLSYSLYDGVISNFGALNCVPHLRPVALGLGRLVRPGGYLALGLISRFCLWETLFHSLHGRFSKAARRWGNGGRATVSLNGSAGFAVYYRPVREVIEAFRPEFRLERRYGIGILVPPSYLEPHARRVPDLTKLAARIDQSITQWPICRAAADHTLLLFRRERPS